MNLILKNIHQCGSQEWDACMRVALEVEHDGKVEFLAPWGFNKHDRYNPDRPAYLRTREDKLQEFKDLKKTSFEPRLFFTEAKWGSQSGMFCIVLSGDGFELRLHAYAEGRNDETPVWASWKNSELLAGAREPSKHPEVKHFDEKYNPKTGDYLFKPVL